MFSLDGILWQTSMSIGISNNDWNSVIWCQELNNFIAIASAGQNSKLAFSSDGKYWKLTDASVNNGLSCIAWSPSLNIFSVLSIKYSSIVNQATILSNWNGIPTTPLATQNMRSVTWIPDLDLFIAVGLSGTILTSPDGIDWTSRTPPASNNWNSVAWSPSLNLLVAVSNSATTTNSIITSPNGVTWTARTAPFGYNWYSICWSPSLGIFVAIAQSAINTSTIMTSTDGITWTAQTAPNVAWWQIIWSPELSIFVAVGTSSVITSTNGTTWTSRTPSFSSTWKSIAWSSTLNLFVAVADSGSFRVMTSPDGINWTNRTAPNTIQWWNICWSSELGLFVVVSADTSNNSIMYSSNGIDWTTSLSGINGPAWYFITYSPKYNSFVSVANSSSMNNIMKTINHNNLSLINVNTTSSSLDLSNVISSNYPTLGNIKNVLKNTYTISSSLTWNWTSIIIIPQTTGGSGVSFNTYYYMASSSSGIAYSVDLINWVSVSATANNWNSIAWSPSLNIGIVIASSGTNNRISRIDAFNSISTPTFIINNNWTSVCWSPDLLMFVAVASSGTDNRVAITYNGTTWLSKQSAANNNWTSICWSPDLNIFVAVASSGTGNRVMTSSDGIFWISRNSAADNNWTSVCWSSELNLFVAVASSGTNNRIMTSSNGITWNSITSPADNDWTSVIWISDLYIFVACASSGTNRLMYSTNGTTWALLPTPTNSSWRCIYWDYINSKLIIVASNGSNNIITSNIFKPNYNNSLVGGRFLIDNSTGFISLNTYTTPTYQFEYTDNINSRLFLTNDTITANSMSIGIDSTGTSTIFSSTNRPLVNIVNHNGVDSGLALNGTLIQVTPSILNSLSNLSFGNASSLKPLSVDNSFNLLNINQLSCNTVSISNPFNYVTPGTSMLGLPLITDSNNKIGNINKLTSNSLQVNNNTLLTYSNALVNNSVYNSMINYTFAFNLGNNSYVRTLLWIPELTTGIAVQYSNSSSCFVSTTTNGTTWSTTSSQIPVILQCVSLSWSPTLNLCLATSESGSTVSISSNLNTWTSITGFPNAAWRTSCWSSFANIFVIFGSNITGNSIWTSTNGTNWTARGGPNATIRCCISISSPINLIIACASNSNIYYSSDGINWTTLAVSFSIGSIAYSSSLNRIIAVRNDTSNTLRTSTDGINWSTVTIASIPSSTVMSNVEWSESLGIFLITMDNSQVMISKDGLNWNLVSSWSSVYSASNAIPGVTKIVWASSLNRFLFSTTYTLNNNGIMGFTNSNQLSSATYSQSNVSNTVDISVLNRKIKQSIGTLYNCLNTWYTRTSVADNSWTSICWSSSLSLFIAVASSGTNNRVMTSPNGMTWTSQTSAADNNWTSVCWSTELTLFVAVASSGTGDRVMTSTNGTTWTSQTSAANNNWTSVCWSPELTLFVAVALSGTGNRVMTSTNGINWTSRNSASNNNWTSVCWNSDMLLFVAVSSSGVGNRIMTSPDGITWTSRTSAADYNWVSIIYIYELNCSVAISNHATNIVQNAIMISSDCYNWKLLSYKNSTAWTSICWSQDYAMFVTVSNTGTANRVNNSKLAYNAIKNTIIANPNTIKVNNLNGRVSLGVATPTFQLHLSSDSAAKAATSTWTVSSDERLKENIQDADLDMCYNNINDLRLVRYTWKDEVYTSDQVSDRSKLGWIAQEVETVFPKAVEKHNIHGYEDCRTLNNDQIIASLYGCIQKLIQKCEIRQNTIDELKNKYSEISTVFDNLEFVTE
jgi:hypothetical protein